MPACGLRFTGRPDRCSGCELIEKFDIIDGVIEFRRKEVTAASGEYRHLSSHAEPEKDPEQEDRYHLCR